MTKYQRSARNDQMLNCCEQTMRKVCGDFEGELREFNGEPDHVHLLVLYVPKSLCPPL